MQQLLFWAFQGLNGATAAGMVLAPGATHEALLPRPLELTYSRLGFSRRTAAEMLHNVLRGHGAALLAVSLFLAVTGPAAPSSALLIALVCGCSLGAHACTYAHHARTPLVLEALGHAGLAPLRKVMAINAVFAAAAAWCCVTQARGRI